MDAEKISSLRHLYEVARPKKLTGEARDKAVRALLEACEPDFAKLFKRPDGSRFIQLIFRRGNEEIRTKLFEALTPVLFEIATTRYSFHIFESIVKNGSAKNIEALVLALKGNYDSMLSHAIGMKMLALLYDRAKSEQRLLMFMDFFGPAWKSSKTIKTFAEICSQGGTVRSSAIECLRKCLDHACDKGAAQFSITHELISILGQEQPDALGHFVLYMKDLAFTRTGSELAIRCIKVAKKNEIMVTLKILDEVRKEPVQPLQVVGQVADAEDIDEEEEEEEEEEAQENEEGAQEEQIQDASTNTAKMAIDQWGWRVLSCAVSWLDDLDVVRDEVLPNLMQDWSVIRGSKFGMRVLLRMVKLAPSVFRGMDFQRSFVHESLLDVAVPVLMERVVQDMKDMELREVIGGTPDGSKLVVALLSVCEGKPEFDELAESVFNADNVVHKFLHKMVKTAIQSDLKEAKALALKAVNEVGLEEVLNSPGAWVVAELVRSDKKLATKAKALIKKKKIEGPAIVAITNPLDSTELQRKNRYREKEERQQRQQQKREARAAEEKKQEEPPAPVEEEPVQPTRRRRRSQK